MQSSSHSWHNEINDPIFMSSNTMNFCTWGDNLLESFILALYFGEMISPLATATFGVDVGKT